MFDRALSTPLFQELLLNSLTDFEMLRPNFFESNGSGLFINMNFQITVAF